MHTDKRQTGLKSKSTHDAGRADETAAATEEAREADGATTGIPVVALGGSAGALEPFNQFFAGMPADSGAAFVVIQHLSPTHESLLPELLARHTQMKVMQARDGVPVEPNCVYVIPPNQDLGIRDGILYLAEPVKPKGIPMPIDFFLCSLAEDRQERAVCILLSGAGSDGTMGVRAIRGAGGLTMAQDPQTAQYGDLPRSAIATKLVDQVLQPEQMPDVVVQYLQQPYVQGGESEVARTAGDGNPGGLDEILTIVRNRTDCDFRCYKQHTILRRIERRMGLRHISDIAQYSKVLGQDAGEVSQLLKDLLINVTTFFRDPEAFEELRVQVIAPLLAAKPADEPLRVWVTGCSTGEEAYSLAILLQEEMVAARKNCSLQVFATDIDEEALQAARQGFYPDSIVADMDPDRLAKFFIRKEQGWQIVDSLRNTVVFAVQNLISDPPFSRMDLISCRNLLIYLDAETQTKLVPLFHFALVPGGYLFLGKSEGVGGPNDLFLQVSKKAKIFRRSTALRPVVLDSPIVPGKKKVVPVPGAAAKPPSATYADAIRQALLGHFMASVVLVGPRGQILQFHGQTGKYLDLPATDPNLNLLDIAKEGLSLRLRSALHAANDEKKTVVMEGVPITRDAAGPCARVTITPVAQRGAAESLLAVIFEDVSRPAIVGIELPRGHANDATVRQLEDELRLTQQDLQSNIEDLQASNEEMRVSNEEVVSSNEELQSTNEELETSKEELQSVNEELTTVNSQLQEKVEQLDVAYGDMANLLKSTQIATLFLDQQLRIKFFTPATTQVLKLLSSDTGRPVSDLSISFVNYDLTADARAVAQGAEAIERDVRHADGSYYVVRFMPYRTQHDRLDGVVVTFDNVSRLRLATEHERFLADVVETANVAFGVGTPDGRLVTFNQAFADLTGYSREELLQRQLSWNADLTPAEWQAPEIAQLAEAVRTRQPVRYEKEYLRKDGTRVPVELFVQPMFDAAGNLLHYRSFLTDISVRKQLEMERQQAEEQYRNLFTTMIEGFCIIEVIFDDHEKPTDYRFLEVNPAFEKQTGLQDAQGKRMRELAPDLEAHWFEIYGKIALTGEPASFINEAKALHRWYEVSAYRLGGRESRKVAVLFNDVSEIKRAEELLREREEQLRLFVEHAPAAIAMFDKQMRYIAASHRWLAEYGLVGKDLYGRSHYDIFPEIPAQWKEIHRRCLAGAVERAEEDPFVRADGRTQWIRWEVRPWRTGGGAVGGIVVFSEDITARKQADAVQQDTLQRFYAILSCMYSGILLVADEGRVEFANQAFCDLFGLKDAPAELAGLSSHDIIGRIKSGYAQADAAIVRIEEILARRQPVKGEEVAMRDGQTCVRDFVPLHVHGKSFGRLWVHVEISERKQAEAAVAQARDEAEQREAELQTVLDLAPVAVWIAHDPQCRKITGNRYADEFVMQVSRGANVSASAGSGEAVIAYKALRDGVELKPEQLPAQVAAATGKPVAAEMLDMVYSDGRVVQMFMGAMPLFDAEGRTRGAVAAGADVTALRQAENALRESRAKLEAALASMSDAVFISDNQGNFIDFNDAFATFHKFRNKDECARTLAEYPDFLDVFLDDGAVAPLDMWAVSRALRGERVANAVYNLRRKDTGETWVGSYSFGPIRDKDGAIIGSVVVGRDITDSKRAEMEVRHSQQLLQAIIDNCQALIYVKDLAGRITIANQALGDAVGMPPRDILGKTSREILRDPEAGEAHMANDRRIIETGQSLTVEEATPGHVFLSVKFPLRDTQGSIFAMGGVSTDITGRKKAEDDLRKLNRTLQALSQSDRAFLHSKNEKDYLDNVCRIIAQDCGYAMVWIGYAAEDADKTVQPVASTGLEEGYLQTLNVTWADTERGRSPTGMAIRTGEACACSNILTDPLFAPWRADAIARGYAASLVLPLLNTAPAGSAANGGGKAFGAITIYSSKPDAFTPDEVELLRSLADDLAHGLLILRLRARNEQAEAALAASQERLQLALTSADMATFEWDIAQNKRVWSEGVHRLLGTTPATFTGDADEFLHVIHPDDRHAVQAALDTAVATGFYENEYRAVWPDGAIHHIAARGKVHRDREGRPVRMAGVCWDMTKQKTIETEIRQRAEELARFNRAMVDRELRMIDLKKEVNELCAQLNQGKRYPLDFEKEAETDKKTETETKSH